MRLFTGIALEPRVAERLGEAIASLRPAAPLPWSPVANLHITSRFIGEWPEARLPEMLGALGAVEPVGKLEIEVSRFGYFPNPHRPRNFFAGVHAGPGLAELARRMDAALERLGIAREDREYSPHVTLARIRHEDFPENVQALREAVAAVTEFKASGFGSFVADKFHLFLSAPGDEGSVYTSLAEFSL